MGKLKDKSKSLQFLNDEPKTTTSSTGKVKSSKPGKDVHQVFLQQSVTLLAFKDKVVNNGTIAPDVLHPKLLFGVVGEDLPLFIGAVIGASLIIALCLLIITFWKCCWRMTILSKKKEYWLEPKENSPIKGKRKIPVVQSNSVVFLGLKPTRVFDYKREKSVEDCTSLQPFPLLKNQDFRDKPFCEPQHIIMSSQCPEIIISEAEKPVSREPSGHSDCSSLGNTHNQSCSVISVPSVLHKTAAVPVSKPDVSSSNDVNISNAIIHEDSPALYHRSFYSGNFDQHSLYSCGSQLGSDFGLKMCNLTWSNYSLRPSSTSDCYYDLFQKANFCKKRKNRMRSDIAAAIALNRSQSFQLNKDTDSLVENEVEVILNERTTL